MSTTDVAGSVTPIYTPTLPVTNDASILTQADLTATVLSLANRIEYVKQLVDISSENFCGREDDFLFVDEEAHVFGSPRIWHGDGNWFSTQMAAGTVQVRQLEASLVKNHGNIRLRSTSGTTGIMLAAGGRLTQQNLYLPSFKSFKCIVNVDGQVAPLKFEAGIMSAVSISQPIGQVALTFLFDPATSPNWLARSSDTDPASDLFDTGVPPGTTGALGTAYDMLEVRRKTSVSYDWLINGNIVATKTNADPSVPVGGAIHVGPVFGGIVPVFSGTEEIIIDYASFAFESVGRGT